MEDKLLLNDDELDNVVGGIADERDIRVAFNTAAQRFGSLRYEEHFTDSESRRIVDRMCDTCEHAIRLSISKYIANDVINELESYYSQLVSAGATQVAGKVRTIIDELKSSIGV